MSIGWQEIVALTFVVIVVAFAIWRRWRRGSGAACDGCEQAAPERTDEKSVEEKVVHIYRKSR